MLWHLSPWLFCVWVEVDLQVGGQVHWERIEPVSLGTAAPAERCNLGRLERLEGDRGQRTGSAMTHGAHRGAKLAPIPLGAAGSLSLDESVLRSLRCPELGGHRRVYCC